VGGGGGGFLGVGKTKTHQTSFCFFCSGAVGPGLERGSVGRGAGNEARATRFVAKQEKHVRAIPAKSRKKNKRELPLRFPVLPTNFNSNRGMTYRKQGRPSGLARQFGKSPVLRAVFDSLGKSTGPEGIGGKRKKEECTESIDWFGLRCKESSQQQKPILA